MTFRPNESSLFFTVAIFDDEIPETNETFVVSVSRPTGGARVGDQTSAAMTILTNDDAHGLIGFSSTSRSIIISEMDRDVSLPLGVQRSAGVFGDVRVDWELSGTHAAGEIVPASGQVSHW